MSNVFMQTRDDYSDIVMTTLSKDCEIICIGCFHHKCHHSMRDDKLYCEHMVTQNWNIFNELSKSPTPIHGVFSNLK